MNDTHTSLGQKGDEDYFRIKRGADTIFPKPSLPCSLLISHTFYLRALNFHAPLNFTRPECVKIQGARNRGQKFSHFRPTSFLPLGMFSWILLPTIRDRDCMFSVWRHHILHVCRQSWHETTKMSDYSFWLIGPQLGPFGLSISGLGHIHRSETHITVAEQAGVRECSSLGPQVLNRFLGSPVPKTKKFFNHVHGDYLLKNSVNPSFWSIKIQNFLQPWWRYSKKALISPIKYP